MDDYVLAFVMAGGRGSRLKILTKHRTKSAVTLMEWIEELNLLILTKEMER